MYVSKNVILGLLLAGAGLLGWASQSLFAHGGDPEASVAFAPVPGQFATGPTATTNPVAPAELPGQGLSGTPPAVSAPGSDANVYMTIVNSSGGTQEAEPRQATATASATSTLGASDRTTQAVSYAPAAGSGPAGPRGATGPVGPSGNTSQPQVTVNGNNITIATNGAVVMIGDDARLNASTGDTAASGTVAIDAQGSTLQSGSSTVFTGAGTASKSTSATIASASTTGLPTHSNSSLDSMLNGLGGTGASVAIAGFEDHSVSVIGDDHLVTYDDSNVFLNRVGQINANTGDTDSSGLNVVDAIDSVVGSGNSGDGEGDDDEEEEEADEELPAGIPAAEEDEPDSDVAGEAREASESRLSTMSSVASPSPASASVDDEDVATTATGSNAFVIGADGFDDVSIRVTGNRDIVTYDDSNVVLGGVGNVNAQIGDSDTAGAVVMGVRNSYIQAGCEGDLCYSGQTP